MAEARRAPSSPGNITGMIGCDPGTRSNPASVISDRNSVALSRSCARGVVGARGQLERGERPGGHRGGDGVGEQVGPRPLAQQVDDLAVGADVAARRAAERLAEGAGEDVDAVHDPEELRGAAAARADEADGVRVVDHDQRVVPLGQVADLVQRGEGAVHGEDAVGDDDAAARVRGGLRAAPRGRPCRRCGSAAGGPCTAGSRRSGEAWLSSSEMTASSASNSVSNTPPLASKQEE